METLRQSTIEVPIEAHKFLGGVALHAEAAKLTQFAPNPQYEAYLRMHKVLVGDGGAAKLGGVFEALKDESLPRYLAAAGSAAVEAAVVQQNLPQERRLRLLDEAVTVWRRAMGNQLWLNQSEQPYMADYAMPYRLATDIAVMPLLRGIVQRDVSRHDVEGAFADCLRVAQANIVQRALAARAGALDAFAEHTGLAYELNALLAFNRRKSQMWFIIPSVFRADSGYYHRRQTHDLLLINQKWGQIQEVSPIEIKAVANAKERERYMAMLVRGKMHLSAYNLHAPEHTLRAITAVHEGTASPMEERSVAVVSRSIIDMAKDYCSGPRLHGETTHISPTAFRDKTSLNRKWPGLRRATAAS